MITTQTNTDNDPRAKVLTALATERPKSVLDVGGDMHQWAKGFVTHIFDINTASPGFHFQGDICSESSWVQVQQWVKEHGKFDFAICTQTLEDIRNPQLTLTMLPHVAKRGYIDVPNKRFELSKSLENCAPQDMKQVGIDQPYCGYMHHRWLFSIQDGTLVLFPKLNFVDRIIALQEWIAKDPHKACFLSFCWEESLPYRTWNNDFLGPNSGVVMDGYRNQLVQGM